MVLILVVVEDVLVLIKDLTDNDASESLNPCCGGRCSSTYSKDCIVSEIVSLNPCCGGRCSSTMMAIIEAASRAVLILVVVEDVLVLNFIRLN